MDGDEDGPHHRTGNGYLSQLEGDGASVTDIAVTYPDQFQCQADDVLIRRGFGYFDAAQQGGQIVRQRVELQPHLNFVELPACRSHVAQGVFDLHDVLLGDAALVVEPHHPARVCAHVGGYEAGTREQLARIPFNFRDHPARAPFLL